MGLFGFGKKKVEVKEGCCCGSTLVKASANECCCACGGNECHIKVLGAGCRSCHEQYENVKKAVADMNLEVKIEYITDMGKVMSYGVMSMPALVVNEKVVAMGKVLKAADVVALLHKLGF